MNEAQELREDLARLRREVLEKRFERDRTGGMTVVVCDECDERAPIMVLLHDELWKQIAKFPKEWLCLQCMEGRLGRLITADDLKPGRLKDEFAMGYELFRRQETGARHDDAS